MAMALKYKYPHGADQMIADLLQRAAGEARASIAPGDAYNGVVICCTW